MKNLFVALFLMCSSAFSQDIAGSWRGELNVGGMKLPLVLNVSDSVWTLDSPNQNTFGIAVDSSWMHEGQLFFMVTRIGAQYFGEYAEVDGKPQFKGEFKQMGQTFPLTLVKLEESFKKPERPQEPKGPFPYKTKDVTFKSLTSNGETIKLAGTLTYPKTGKPQAAVVLVSGSGPQNRDEELMGHKPFAVVADYLTRQGIAVLRYDDRGVAESEGDFQSANSFDLADDAEAAFAYLNKKFKKAKVGIAGHSEGGLIAPVVAARNEDVDFIVLLAGPGTPMDYLLQRQSAIIMELNGMDSARIASELELSRRIFDWVKSDHSDKEIKEAISKLIDKAYAEDPENFEGNTPEQVKKLVAARMLNPWFKTILDFDPEAYLTKVNCPVMAVNGELDCQVPCEENLAAIEKHLATANNEKVMIKAYPKMNHLFQTCETGAMSEYALIEETFSEEVLKDMAEWILGF